MKKMTDMIDFKGDKISRERCEYAEELGILSIIDFLDEEGITHKALHIDLDNQVNTKLEMLSKVDKSDENINKTVAIKAFNEKFGKKEPRLELPEELFAPQGAYAINVSQVSVYSSYDFNERIAGLDPGETFIILGQEWHNGYFWSQIYVSNWGQMKLGWVVLNGGFTLYSDYPFGSIYYEGAYRSTFKVVQNTNLYNGDKGYMRTLYVGDYIVATPGVETGEKKHNWMATYGPTNDLSPIYSYADAGLLHHSEHPFIVCTRNA